MRLYILLLAAVAAVLLLQVSVAGTARRGAELGGWYPIKNLSDPYMGEIAEFAIKVHNDDAKTGLVLKKVAKGEEQIVVGSIYGLVVVVEDGADTRSFEAKVWDMPWEKFRRLDSFRAVQGNA